MARSEPTVSASIEVEASTDTVYALLTDLDELAQFAEETTSMRWVKGVTVTPGAVFQGTNRNGAHRWSTRCTVTDAVPGRVFAFDVTYPPLGIPVARWQYDLEPATAGCRVTESTWDRRSRVFAAVASRATGVRDRTGANTAHIAATLQRLRDRVAQG